jgi:predicted site-specific integrase-resolvase
MDLTTKQVAERIGVKQVTVRSWCEKGLFKNARKENSPRGEYWMIPETDLENFELPPKGRKPSKNQSKAALAKRRQREQETKKQ